MTSTEASTTLPEQNTMDNFYNGIHQLMTARRATKKKRSRSQEPDNVVSHDSILSNLIEQCEATSIEEDSEISKEQRWKLFLLAIIFKRYHSLSPEAVANSRDNGGGPEVATGQGERQTFYQAIMHVFDRVSDSTEDEEVSSQNNERTAAALQVLVRAAPHAGGTRDICTLMEYMLNNLLLSGLELKRKQLKAANGGKGITFSFGRRRNPIDDSS